MYDQRQQHDSYLIVHFLLQFQITARIVNRHLLLLKQLITLLYSMKEHNYEVITEWTGNMGNGTLDYKSYNRNHKIIADGKYSEIHGSSDPSFLGDKTRYNPEDLFLSSLSACHMLWYLHLCSVHKIIVTQYIDHASGVMEETVNGSGKFTRVILHPKVVISNLNMMTKANQLHQEANKMCFIANSCNFNIEHRPNILVE
ncbi:OsmC family protein [uncultured Maribacter sp.]|uniref:OsmC family protein n=1 Tax=uncultured Maribacter sp. TaxID=431308 RepID=UPI0030DCD5DE